MLRKIWVSGFRNLEEQLVDLEGRRSTIVYGENNQGKTNFLESIYFLGSGHSPVENKIENLVCFEQKEAVLGLEFETKSEKKKIYFKLNKQGKREGLFDSKRIHSYKRLSDYLRVEYVSADVIQLFQFYADSRRRDLDRFLTTHLPDYGDVLKQYERVIKHKNALLKSDSDLSSLAVWNEKLVTLADKIVSFRLKGLKELERSLETLSNQFGDPYSKSISIQYTVKSLENALEASNSYKEVLLSKLLLSRGKERALGYSLYGPHRDDFVINVDGRSLFTFLSRGINRLFAHLYKVAQLDLLVGKIGFFPVILLDDAFAEIADSLKRKIIRIYEERGQLVYTTVLPGDSDLFDNPSIFQMTSGKLSSG
jgi:DNA replication and repair protein RecF